MNMHREILVVDSTAAEAERKASLQLAAGEAIVEKHVVSEPRDWKAVTWGTTENDARALAYWPIHEAGPLAVKSVGGKSVEIFDIDADTESNARTAAATKIASMEASAKTAFANIIAGIRGEREVTEILKRYKAQLININMIQAPRKAILGIGHRVGIYRVSAGYCQHVTYIQEGEWRFEVRRSGSKKELETRLAELDKMLKGMHDASEDYFVNGAPSELHLLTQMMLIFESFKGPVGKLCNDALLDARAMAPNDVKLFDVDIIEARVPERFDKFDVPVARALLTQARDLVKVIRASSSSWCEIHAEPLESSSINIPGEPLSIAKTHGKHGSRLAGPISGPSKEPSVPAVGRNEPCPCGSGEKYKNCHGKLR